MNRMLSTAARLDGTVCVITGGGRGIGRVLAQALAAAGAAVGLIARSGGELAETVRLVRASGGAAAAARADVTDERAVATAIGALRRRLGPVDLLVNNAGISGPVGYAWQVGAADWWRAVEINLRGVFLCSRVVLPAMTARGAGRIVNITSEAGVLRWPQVSAYSVSKAAVIKFTENLAAEASRSGVQRPSRHHPDRPVRASPGRCRAARIGGGADVRVDPAGAAGRPRRRAGPGGQARHPAGSRRRRPAQRLPPVGAR